MLQYGLRCCLYCPKERNPNVKLYQCYSHKLKFKTLDQYSNNLILRHMTLKPRQPRQPLPKSVFIEEKSGIQNSKFMKENLLTFLNVWHFHFVNLLAMSTSWLQFPTVCFSVSKATYCTGPKESPTALWASCWQNERKPLHLRFH